MTEPKKPLPKPVQYLILVAMIALIGVPLDQFTLVDSAGSAPVFFDPAKFPAPRTGAHVKNTANIVEQRVNAAPRLVVRKLDIR